MNIKLKNLTINIREILDNHIAIIKNGKAITISYKHNLGTIEGSRTNNITCDSTEECDELYEIMVDYTKARSLDDAKKILKNDK